MKINNNQQENSKLALLTNIENSNLAEVSPLISVPIQNRKNLFRIKSSSLQSLVDHDLTIKKFYKEKKQGYKDRSGSSIHNTTKVIDYLQNNELGNKSSLLREQILDIKNNNNKYKNFQVQPESKEFNTELTLYLEDIIFLLLLLNKNKKDKVIIRKLLKKLNLQNNIRHTTRFNTKTPISLELKKVFYNYLQNLKKTIAISNLTENNKIANLNKIIEKISQFKPLIEYNFKVKNVGPIQSYKNTNSTSYKSLSKKDRNLIDILNIIDLIKSGNFKPYINSNILNIPNNLYNSNNSNNSNIFIKNEDKTNLLKTDIEKTDNIDSKLIEKVSLNNKIIMQKRKFLRYISPFNYDLSYSKNHMYNFNKKNDYNLFKNEKNIYHLLEAAFLKMDSLISKAFFSVTANNISIHLFFY